MQYSQLLNLKMDTPIILAENVVTDQFGKPIVYLKAFNNPNEKVIEIIL